MDQWVYRKEDVRQVRAKRRDGLDDIRNGFPDSESLLPVEHPDSPIDLKVASQDSQNVPKRPERVAWAGLRIALTTGNEQLGMGFVRPAGKFPHQRGFSTSCISQQEYRHAVSSQGVVQACLKAG